MVTTASVAQSSTNLLLHSFRLPPQPEFLVPKSEILVVSVIAYDNTRMMDDDKTAEEDAIDISEDGEETEATEVHSTTTDFSKITFFVDRTSQQDVITEEHLASELDERTDSFDAIDHTDEDPTEE